MSSIEVNGGNVVYEILGDSGDLIVLTPGGRFSKEIPGLRPLAEALVAGGYRVLLWDRPNCGASDVQFYGQSESHMRAETLHGLLGALGVQRCIIAGGSGGARDSGACAHIPPSNAWSGRRSAPRPGRPIACVDTGREGEKGGRTCRRQSPWR